MLLERTYNREAWMPKWSPDGQEFVFFNTSPSVLPEIWVVNRDGSDPRVVYGFEGPLEDWAGWGWSPDGQQIAAEYQVDGKWACLIAHVDGSGEAQQGVEHCPDPWSSAFWPKWGGSRPESPPLSVPAVAPSGRAIYVDANAPATGSNGSPAAPFNTIQTAIAAAGPGDTIKVASGTYDENLIIAGKTLILEGGYDPSNWEVSGTPADTVIDGGRRANTVWIEEGSHVLFSRFAVINGQSTDSGRGHQCGAGGITARGAATEVTVRQAIIRDNAAQPPCGGGGVESSHGATVAVINAMIVNNTANDGGGILVENGAAEDSQAIVVNSTIADNRPDGVIIGGAGGSALLINTIVWGHVGDKVDTVHCLIDADPRFVDPANGDYHLRPDSPAVDAGTPQGAPSTDIDGDPRPTGAGVDVGADEVME
jgi:hypothetical protein